MTMRNARTILPFLTVLLVFRAAPAPAQSVQKEVETAETLQSEPESVSAGVDLSQAPPAKTAHGIEYRNGGVGKEERDALHLVAKGYTLKVVLSAKQDSAFARDATIRIVDASGKSVFEAADVGPLFFANLPAGKYKVTVDAYGQPKEQSVALASGKQTAISFSW